MTRAGDWATILLVTFACAVLSDDACGDAAAQDFESSSSSTTAPSTGSSNPRPAGGAGAPAENDLPQRQRPPVTSSRRQLALELAVVAAHEGALENLSDTALVWQVVEVNGGDSVIKRLAFLRRHSGRALGLKPCDRAGNCRWSVDLLRAPNAAPPSTDAEWWHARRAQAWRLVREYAANLVAGGAPWRPCSRPPRTWGYSGDVEKARARGLVPMGCAGTLNDGFEPLARVVLATTAAGAWRNSK